MRLNEAKLLTTEGWSRQNSRGEELVDAETAQRCLRMEVTIGSKVVIPKGEWIVPTVEDWKKDEQEQEYAKRCRRYHQSDEGYGHSFDYSQFGLVESKGWAKYQTNSDAAYFGVWINREAKQIVTYAEGDLTVEDAATDEEFEALMQSLYDFHGEYRGYFY
tara:strand:+ start:292 stop:774 length:483 start_codon:yes stop_codon:yes gene_type:complete